MVAELQTQNRRWTYSELQELGGEWRVELYDGELEEMTSPTIRHQELLHRLLKYIEQGMQGGIEGKIYLSPVDLYISETRFVIPDLMFVSQARLETQAHRARGRSVFSRAA